MIYKNKPVDFRVILQKDGTKEWTCSGIIAKFGCQKRIYTNTPSALYIASEALQLILGLSPEQALEKENEIIMICKEACQIMEQAYGIYADVGIDVVVDSNKKVWILEINKIHQHTIAKPDMYIRVITKPLAYAKALAGFNERREIFMGIRPRFLYVTNLGTSTVEIFNIANPLLQEHVGEFGEGDLSSPCGLAITDNILYVSNAGGSQNIEIYDISNPLDPAHKGEFGQGELINPNGIAITGTTLYITNLLGTTASGEGSVEIYNVTDPLDPKRVKQFGEEELNRPNGLAIIGNILYVSNATDSTIEIYNISDPENPTHVKQFGSLTEISHPIGLAITDNLLYVANFDGVNGNTVSIYNITDTENPVFLKRFGSGFLSGPIELAVDIDRLYVVSSGNSTVQIFDISNPAEPMEPSHVGGFNSNLSTPFGLIIVPF